ARAPVAAQVATIGRWTSIGWRGGPDGRLGERGSARDERARRGGGRSSLTLEIAGRRLLRRERRGRGRDPLETASRAEPRSRSERNGADRGGGRRAAVAAETRKEADGHVQGFGGRSCRSGCRRSRDGA